MGTNFFTNEKDNTLLEKKVTQDPKLDEFIRVINEDLFDKGINHVGKLVVFSESKETTEYLACELNNKGLTTILTVTNANRGEMMNVLKENFDANYTGEKKDDYNIVSQQRCWPKVSICIGPMSLSIMIPRGTLQGSCNASVV